MKLFTKDYLYPQISIKLIPNPSRFYAIPFFGFFIKCLMLIPQAFELMILGFVLFFMTIVINPWVILFTGKYWDAAYQLTAGLLKLNAKIYFFFFGLTNTYPGFDFTIHDDYTVEIQKPAHSNRLLNFPFFGMLFKIIILIPFLIYENMIRNASYLAVIGASFVVLFTGRYPESSYELARDEVRLNMAGGMYLLGLSDTYPSFWISMNHKAIKWALIILAIVFSIFNFKVSPSEHREYRYGPMKFQTTDDNTQKNMMPQDENTNPQDTKSDY